MEGVAETEDEVQLLPVSPAQAEGLGGITPAVCDQCLRCQVGHLPVSARVGPPHCHFPSSPVSPPRQEGCWVVSSQ